MLQPIVADFSGVSNRDGLFNPITQVKFSQFSVSVVIISILSWELQPLYANVQDTGEKIFFLGHFSDFITSLAHHTQAPSQPTHFLSSTVNMPTSYSEIA